MCECNSNMPKTIRVKYQTPEVPRLKKISQGDWIDLSAAEDVDLESGVYTQIPLGVAMQLPEGYEAIVAPRSSTFKRFGILMANSIGVIDNSYCGDNDFWSFPCYTTAPVHIPAGTRICQFRIQKTQPPLIFDEVETLDNEDRGGFGSTGV